MLVGSIQYVVHLGFYAPGKDDVQRNIPLPREVNVRSWHDFVSLRATCDARPGETQQAMPQLVYCSPYRCFFARDRTSLSM